MTQKDMGRFSHILSWLFFTVMIIRDAVGNDIDRCPSNLERTDYLKAFREKCYEFHNTERSWYLAHDICLSRGGWLVQIFDWATQSFIHNALRSLNWKRNGVWLGAHDLDYEGQWKWVQGYPLSFTNWASDQPGGCKVIVVCVEDCANLRLDDNGLWHDYPCDMEPYSFVCEYEMQATSTSTTTTMQTTTTTTALNTTTKSSQVSSSITNMTTVSTISSSLTSTSSSTRSSPLIQNTTLTSLSVSMTTTASPSTQETSRPSTKFVPTTKETTTSGIKDPDKQKSGQNSKSEMTRGEVAGLAVALLGLAFLSGVICTYFAVKKHRRSKRLETPRTDDVRYVVQPSNQATIDERRLVLNILYSAPDSPPKYDEIDHNNGQARFLNNARNMDQKCPLDHAIVSHDSFPSKSTVSDYEPHGQSFTAHATDLPLSKGDCKKIFVDLPDDDETYCTHDDTVFYKEKADLEAKYETPAGSNHPYRKVSKTQKYESTDESNADHLVYDDARAEMEVKGDSLDLEEQHVYCAMIDVHQPETEAKALNDSVYEEPISAKELDDYLSHKYTTKAISDEYVGSDSINSADSVCTETNSKISEERAMEELEAVLAEYDVVPGNSRDSSMTHDVTRKDNESMPYEIPKNANNVIEEDASTVSGELARVYVADDAYLLVCDDDTSRCVICGIDNPTYNR